MQLYILSLSYKHCELSTENSGIEFYDLAKCPTGLIQISPRVGGYMDQPPKELIC
jgi:hypothetical protein